MTAPTKTTAANAKATDAAAKATEAATKAAAEATATAQQSAEKLTSTAAAVADKAATEFTKTVDEATERFQEFNAKFVDAAKQSGNLGVDTYEKAVSSLLDLQEKVVDATPVEWVADLAKAQVSFARELTTTVTSTARDLLK
ncbi:hypothetical protein C6369_021630 [Rhodococcus rhodochrous]|uniref:hypothetical protein n=1 Tax=Rhodococcus rhodochrous TaxID=1829 RepID=UPI000D059D4A|nr:hypothetical protein [Rhodococcus rhodochrous]AYA26785.1 hypothetical protein C6369_021630 [Rhodococcus rhodochrous]